MQDEHPEVACGGKAKLLESWIVLFESDGFKRAADLMTDGLDSSAKYEEFYQALQEAQVLQPHYDCYYSAPYKMGNV